MSSAVQRQSSSGSEGSAAVDEKKRKRMLSNRESARRSRMKKQKQIDDVAGEISRLQMSNTQIQQLLDARERSLGEMEAKNNVLRAQEKELTDRLHSLESLLHIFQDVNGLASDTPAEMPGPFLDPWHHAYPMHPIPASSDMFFG